jgi:arylsulfatase A-like enzyme
MRDGFFARSSSRLVPALVVALLLSLACSGPSSGPTPGNLLLVSLDTLRADHLGAWGHPGGTSPHLDRLARQGTMFGTCIAQAASTLPSHRSLFQSRPASLTGDDHPMLAEVLREAGWETVAFTGGGNIAAELGFGRGFDRYEENRAGLAWGGPALASWLAEGNREPFFAFVHTYDPHVPYDPPPPYDGLYSAGYSGPVVGPETRELCRRIRGPEKERPEVSAADRRQLRALYTGGVRHTDAELGRILRGLERDGFADRTLVVVVSDHGEEFWDHGTVLHSHSLFQELVHVPLIFRGEGRAGTLVPETVRNLDVAPTVLDALAVPVPATHRGESLLPRLAGAAGESLPAVSEMGSLKSILDAPWKLVVDGQGRGALFDLSQDPGETENVAARYPEVVGGYRRLLEGLGSIVSELADEAPSAELAERLRALGYID